MGAPVEEGVAARVRRAARLTPTGARRVRVRGLALVLPGVLLLLWVVGTEAGWVSGRVLPSPLAVGTAARDFVLAPRRPVLGGVVEFDGAARIHIPASLWRLATAFSLAAAVGIPLGLGIGLSRRLARMVDPLVQALRPIPIFAWLPLAFAWFGLGEGSARFLIFIGAVLPIAVTATDGARRVPRAFVERALVLGTPPGQVWRRVHLPAALPSIVTGLRLGLTLGWMSVIVGELTGTRTGIGVMMFASREIGRLDRVIVGVITFALLGLATDALVRRVGGRFTAWSET